MTEKKGAMKGERTGKIEDPGKLKKREKKARKKRQVT